MHKQQTIFLLLLSLHLWVLYAPTLRYELVWDAKPLILNNPLLQKAFPLHQAFTHGWWELTGEKTSSYDYYRPLAILSFMLEKRVWGLQPVSLRATNILIFNLALIALFFFLRNMREPQNFAYVATALFALYPLHLDNIIWIVGRGDLLMLFFGTMSLLGLNLYLRKNSKSWLAASTLFFWASLYAKEAALFLLPFLFLNEWIEKKRLTPAFHLANCVGVIIFFWVKATVTGQGHTPFYFLPGILPNLQTGIGVLGYYCRSLIFPFHYDMFLPADLVLRPLYALAGAVALTVLAWFFARTRKDGNLWLPLLLITLFLTGHMALAFTTLYPFSISTRYLQIPILGATWLLAHEIGKWKKPGQWAAPVLIVLCFIPAILGNSRVYQNEAHFWERMYHSAPANAFLDYKYGQTFFQAGDYLKAEILFKEALKHPLKTDTAISLSLTQAQIEVNRANYSEANRWLERIALFRLNPNQSLAVSQVRVAILAATGEWQNAARLLNEASRRAPQLELYQRLYRLYLGYGQWQEADRIAAQIHHLKPELAFKTLPPDQENRFSSWPTEQKIAFFIRYGNYGDAIRLIHSLSLNLEQHIGLAKLLYWHGEETAGKKAIDDLLQREGRQTLLLNRLGNFYLNELYRWREALSYFKESLMLAPGQAEIARTAGELAKLLSDPPDLSLLKPR